MREEEEDNEEHSFSGNLNLFHRTRNGSITTPLYGKKERKEKRRKPVKLKERKKKKKKEKEKGKGEKRLVKKLS